MQVFENILNLSEVLPILLKKIRSEKLNHSKEEIFNELKTILNELFEVDAAQITLDAKLYEDLDLDSIDAVDLIVRLQTMTGRKFNPEEFKSVRTVSDVVDIIYNELSHQWWSC